MCSRIIEGYQRHMSDARKKCLSRILRIYWHNTCPVRSSTKEPASVSWLNAADGNGSDTSVECIDFHSKSDHALDSWWWKSVEFGPSDEVRSGEKTLAFFGCGLTCDLTRRGLGQQCYHQDGLIQNMAETLIGSQAEFEISN